MNKIILSGCNGKMGHVITRIVGESYPESVIVAGVDAYGDAYSDYPVFKSFAELTVKGDVIIDFSAVSTLNSLLSYAVSSNTPAVICTTGYSDCQILSIAEAARNVAIFRSGNMSLGINTIIKLAESATRMLGPEFDIEIVEAHHNQKLDAPSGTALMIADAVSNACESNMKYEFDRHSKRMKRSKNEIGIHSIRGGTIVGEHEIIFAGHDEIIRISHSASSREVFAEGAINAAEFLVGKPSGAYDMNNLLMNR